MPKTKTLLISIIIALGVGGIAAALTRGGMDVYASVAKPGLAPPALVFPIVWTILYALMGLSAALIYDSDAGGRETALTLYAVQLAINFVWPLIFFGAQKYLFAFIWLLLLIAAVIAMIVSFFKVKPAAAYLQLPYLAWLLFAGYLNLMVYLLNR